MIFCFRIIALLIFWMTAFHLISQVPFTCEGQFFVSVTNNNRSSIFECKINTNDGQVEFSPINVEPYFFPLNAIGYRYTDNLIYGINPDNNNLFHFDREGNAVFLKRLLGLDPSSGYYSAAITADGNFLILLASRNNVNTHMIEVELTSGNYFTRRIDLFTNGPQAVSINCTDFAFHPTDGLLYGFDSRSRRLVTIAYPSGEVRQNVFPPSNEINRIGACFFDPQGFFYGYGSARFGNTQERSLFRISSVTGLGEKIGEGPIASSKDGCSCPYGISLEKRVAPARIAACETAVYTFIVTNSSSINLESIDFVDELPKDLTAVEVLRNPYGGIVEGLGTKDFLIKNMNLSLGRDSIMLRVISSPNAGGTYANQARLENLPDFLGGSRVSDAVGTVIIGDSTLLDVVAYVPFSITDTLRGCEGQSVTIDLDLPPDVSITWPNGQTGLGYSVNQEAWVPVMITDQCQNYRDSVFVDFFEKPSLAQFPGDFSVFLGEEMVYEPNVIGNGPFQLVWGYSGNQVGDWCSTCSILVLKPTDSGEVTLAVSDDNNCISEYQFSVEVQKDYSYSFPNVLNGAGSGVNAIFKGAAKTQGVMLRSFLVFDRWGGIIYENNSIPLSELAWDGTKGGQSIVPGVYVYLAELIFLDGVIRKHTGTITILR